MLAIAAASRRRVRRRAHVGRQSQTGAALGGVDDGAIPFSTALVLQRALLEASAAEQLWGLAWSVGVSCNRARCLWFAAAALDHLLTWGLAPFAGHCLCLHRHTRADAVAVAH